MRAGVLPERLVSTAAVCFSPPVCRVLFSRGCLFGSWWFSFFGVFSIRFFCTFLYCMYLLPLRIGSKEYHRVAYMVCVECVWPYYYCGKVEGDLGLIADWAFVFCWLGMQPSFPPALWRTAFKRVIRHARNTAACCSFSTLRLVSCVPCLGCVAYLQSLSHSFPVCPVAWLFLFCFFLGHAAHPPAVFGGLSLACDDEHVACAFRLSSCTPWDEAHEGGGDESAESPSSCSTSRV